MVIQKIVNGMRITSRSITFLRAMSKSAEGGRAGAREAEGIGSESAGTSAKEGGTATQ